MVSGLHHSADFILKGNAMLEVCTDQAAAVDAGVTGGAERVELCSGLAVGGLTPSPALIRFAASAPIATMMLVRPRDGDFRYDRVDADLIAADMKAAAEAGLQGVVIGASAADGGLDLPLLARLTAHGRDLGAQRGRPLSLTLHRAFDLCPDPLAALEDAIALGFQRILTSGATPRAVDGVETLSRLVRRAGNRITILAGSGIDADNVDAILASGVREIHASCRSPLGPAGEAEQRFRFQVGPTQCTDPTKVAILKARIDAWIARVDNTLNSTNI